MKRMGYVIGLLIGIPLFIILVNFLFFLGNNPEEEEINTYIQNSIIDTIEIKATFPKGEQYIVGVNRRGRPSAFLFKYPFYLKKYKKNFVILMFEGFDDNRQYRQSLLGRGAFTNGSNNLTVYINKKQLQDSKYGTKENPVPVFAIEFLSQNNSDTFHVSNKLNEVFVGQYLKFFMAEEEFKETFRK